MGERNLTWLNITTSCRLSKRDEIWMREKDESCIYWIGKVKIYYMFCLMFSSLQAFATVHKHFNKANINDTQHMGVFEFKQPLVLMEISGNLSNFRRYNKGNFLPKCIELSVLLHSHYRNSMEILLYLMLEIENSFRCHCNLKSKAFKVSQQ